MRKVYELGVLISATFMSALGCGAGAPDAESEVDLRTAPLASSRESDGYVDTPFGRMHHSCVFAVESGEHVAADGLSVRAPDGKVRVRRKCAFPRLAHSESSRAPTVNGWVDWSSAGAISQTTQAFVRLDSQWNVPANPSTASDQLLYFFTSFEPASGTRIVQPVLQWGVSPAGGGSYWAIASWYVDNAGNASHSTLLRVSSGDTIVGTMVATSCDNNGYADCTWRITTARGADTTVLDVSTHEVYDTVQRGVLEAYNITSCLQYPANVKNVPFIKFSNVNAYQPGSTFYSDPQTSLWNVTTALQYSRSINQMGLECCLGQSSSGPDNVGLGTFLSPRGVCRF